jgi:WD40 repeat protein
VLQASLHGHEDMLIDLCVSKCNRYLASGSKDGVIIIWDLQQCTIIKKLTSDHTQQIN